MPPENDEIDFTSTEVATSTVDEQAAVEAAAAAVDTAERAAASEGGIGEEAAPSAEREGASNREAATEAKAGTAGNPLEAQKVDNRRDYSGFSADVVSALKKLPNSQFNVLSAELRKASSELTELRKFKAEAGEGIPTNFYSHPEGYKLTPDYANASTILEEAGICSAHLQAQLEAIENGDQWQDIVRDEKGNLTLTAPRDSTPRDKAYITNKLIKVNAAQSQAQERVQNISRTFTQRHTNATNSLRGMYEAELKVLPENLRPTKEHLDNAAKYIPQEFNGNPLKDFVVGMYATLANLYRSHKDLESKLAMRAVNTEDQKRAGKPISRQAATRKSDDETFDFGVPEQAASARW